MLSPETVLSSGFVMTCDCRTMLHLHKLALQPHTTWCLHTFWIPICSNLAQTWLSWLTYQLWALTGLGNLMSKALLTS